MKTLFRAAGVALAAILVPGCGEHLSRAVLPNQPPEVQVTQSLVPTPRAVSDEYRARWTGHDPDGRIDHFVYALNPASVDRVDESWVSTRETEWAMTTRASAVESGIEPEREPTVFAVRAVDNRGALSPPRWAAFFPGNIPPTVTITSPKPTSFLIPILGQTVRFIWTGEDPDGQTTTRPVKYKFKLFGPGSEFPINVAVANPDSLRRYYAPNFPGWDSTGADSNQVRFRNLTINQTYLFVVTGFDEASDYDPVFSIEKNMYRFYVGHSKTLGPRLTLFGDDGFEFTPPYRGYFDDPSQYARIQVGSGRLVRFGWSALPMPGSEITGYRWVLDPVDLYDERTRSDPADLRHWSPRSPTNTEVTLGPFTAGPKGTPHRIYVEVEDTNGLRSLGVIHFTVLNLTFTRDLLIVDDTRLRLDQFSIVTHCASPPTGPWPTAAELDTFLYARGGFPWRCYPEGTMTEPGLFNGYDFDTLGTRTGKLDLTVSLAKLGRYRHVIWLVDGTGATYANLGTHFTQPQTALRYMTVPGRFNTLVAYVRQGGKVWLAGGGGAYASQIEWNDRGNDLPTTTFSSITSTRGELVPGRFMYDLPHWRSEIRITRAPMTSPSGGIMRYTGRFGDSSSVSKAGSPYADLTAIRMRPKGEGTGDPLPPQRTNPNDFYQTSFDIEFLQVENYIVENEESTLDTIYRAFSIALPSRQQNFHNVVMTYYHGPEVPAGFVFSGFSLWNFKREDCQGLVDFVLQRIWGLSHSPSVSRQSSLATRKPRP